MKKVKSDDLSKKLQLVIFSSKKLNKKKSEYVPKKKITHREMMKFIFN
jgi:hypothetical protein